MIPLYLPVPPVMMWVPQFISGCVLSTSHWGSFFELVRCEAALDIPARPDPPCGSWPGQLHYRSYSGFVRQVRLRPDLSPMCSVGHISDAMVSLTLVIAWFLYLVLLLSIEGGGRYVGSR